MQWYLLTILFLFDGVPLKALAADNTGLENQETNGFTDAQKTFQEEMLKAHNNYRKQHCVPSLVLDDGLSRGAQSYAKTLVKTNVFAHSTDRDNVGENLYKKSSSKALKLTGDKPTDSWYNEIKDYDFNKPGFSSAAGHLTQVLWKNSNKLGVGIAYSADERIVYVVARYSPAGNVLEQFDENVLSKCS
ncbi:unnamed protein product [Rotaria sordida]|uniref:SCP domain-containing protein n=1 Tax=Rotaria sordida TaxID=392033 RepID=A0A814IXF4_9BILA|nr:unnamed protein product [Rotaria sordida]